MAVASQWTAAYQQARLKWAISLWFLGLTGISGLLGMVLLRSGPNPALIAWLLFLLATVAIIVQPRYGVYLILFFTLVADGVLIPWYPFNKNFSSAESIFYLNDALIFAPVEVFMGLTALTWAAQLFARRRLTGRGGPLWLPMLAFATTLVGGLVYGLARGGNLTIALWEARPMFYLPLMYFLTLNLIENRGQVNVLMWMIMLALFVEGIIGNLYFFVTLGADLSGVQAITEHSAAIHMNSLFVMVIAVWMFKGSLRKRLLLPLFAPFVGLTYLATQRRAAFVAIAIALMLMAIVLYRYNRRLFWTIAPPAAVMALLYLAVFWNHSGALGIPARGIKSVLAPDTSSEEYSSNIYRVLENINISFTIHQSPLFGVGFGNKFFVIVPMADISFFDWWEYITHNSILWVWMKAGLLGFLALLFLIGAMIVVGTQAFNRMPGGDLKATALTLVLYIIMHFVYAYVDMSWDTQSMIYVGTAAGLLGGLEWIAAQPVPQRPLRWRWQKPRPAEPVIEPLP
jgi:hypothetical protein